MSGRKLNRRRRHRSLARRRRGTDVAALTRYMEALERAARERPADTGDDRARRKARSNLAGIEQVRRDYEG